MILIVDNNDDDDGNGDAVVGDEVELEDGVDAKDDDDSEGNDGALGEGMIHEVGTGSWKKSKLNAVPCNNSGRHCRVRSSAAIGRCATSLNMHASLVKNLLHFLLPGMVGYNQLFCMLTAISSMESAVLHNSLFTLQKFKLQDCDNLFNITTLNP